MWLAQREEAGLNRARGLSKDLTSSYRGTGSCWRIMGRRVTESLFYYYFLNFSIFYFL